MQTVIVTVHLRTSVLASMVSSCLVSEMSEIQSPTDFQKKELVFSLHKRLTKLFCSINRHCFMSKWVVACVQWFPRCQKALFPTLDREQCASVTKTDKGPLETAPPVHTHVLLPTSTLSENWKQQGRKEDYDSRFSCECSKSTVWQALKGTFPQTAPHLMNNKWPTMAEVNPCSTPLRFSNRPLH